jgi:formiminotetrahydrofolate cyclodeaminase
VSDLASSCEEKMQSLDDFLAEFVDDEDGEAYAEYIESQSKPQSSEEQALTVSPK